MVANVDVGALPAAPVVTNAGIGPISILNWTDGTPCEITRLRRVWGDPANEIGYRIERAEGG